MTTSRPTFSRSSENTERFANDGSLESVEGMLRKLAAKCFARVSAMGLGMDYDDVLQEMRLSYVKAKATWNPNKEVNGRKTLFVTYCQTACQNNFNIAIKKMERERREFGMFSYDAIQDDDGELITGGVDMVGEDNVRPEYDLERRQAMNAAFSRLSPSARRLVTELLRYEAMDLKTEPRLGDIARMCQITGEELRRVKLEILKVYGVHWRNEMTNMPKDANVI